MVNEENKQKETELVEKMEEIPLRLKAESQLPHGIVMNIFDLKLEHLIFEKMYLMFEKLNPAKKNLLSEKNDYVDKRNELLRTVDFKAELGITTKPTKDDKEAVIAPKLLYIKEAIADLEDEIAFYNDKIIILNDLIKMRRTELKIDAELMGDD